MDYFYISGNLCKSVCCLRIHHDQSGYDMVMMSEIYSFYIIELFALHIDASEHMFAVMGDRHADMEEQGT